MSKPVARKYKFRHSTGLTSTRYGSKAITSILANFEYDIMRLQAAREHYKPGSKAYAKRWDKARLEAAQAIMDLKAEETVEAPPTLPPRATKKGKV